jgi:isoleucyl-tRNA synthetase
MRDSGADIIRMWALTVDFTEDHRIGKEILTGVSDQYRKLRNSFRYLLGALEGYSDAEAVPVADMPELERYMLHLLADMDAKMRAAVDDFDFNTYVRLISDFANNDLSAFFFDIRKDCLYCDAPDSLKRRAYRTVLDILFQAMVRYAAPVIVFTAEEVWQTRYPDPAHSVHFSDWPAVDAAWVDAGLAQKWTLIRSLRTEVTAKLEEDRREKRIGSSLEAEVDLVVAWPKDVHAIAAVDLAEIAIVSDLSFSLRQSEGGHWADVTTRVTTNHKCGRCWRHLPEVSEDGSLCGRCEEVVNG